MDRNNRIIYNFGPDGRDACWAALSNSWSRCSNQQGSFNSRSVNLCRPTKKTNILSPRPQPLPSSSPRTPKRKSFKQLAVQQQPILAKNRISSSVEVMKQVVLEPSSINDQCNCSQSGYSERSVVNSFMSNNNNNNDNDKNNQKFEVLETDGVNQKQQQLMCVTDSGSSTEITKLATVYAEKPVLVIQNEFCDHILSGSPSPTPSTSNKQPTESALQLESEKDSSISGPLVLFTANKQSFESEQQIESNEKHSSVTLSNTIEQQIESVQQIEGDSVSSMSSSLTLSDTVEQSIESVQQIEDDNVSSMPCPLTSSITVEQQIESVQQMNDENALSISCPLIMPIATDQKIESENISSESCPLSMSTTAEQNIESVQKIEVENVSSVSGPLTMSIAIEQKIENEQQIESDPVLSMPSLLSLSIAIEQTVPTENSVMTEVVVANHDKVSPVLSPQFPMMSTTDVENSMIVKIISPSPQPHSKHQDECPVQSNTGMMMLSENPALSKYEMKIREIDNNIISYSKSILGTVLVVVLLRVLF
ncbi:hypothetical protein ACI65C_005823 [Semiaphis heraclei]